MNIKDIDGKKILIIVPHQDDEIHVAGNLLTSLNKKSNIYVVFSTNGDFLFNAKIRYKEAIKSLKILGVKKQNVIFMGYSDQAYDQKDHMYNSNGIWKSLKGRNYTYSPKGFEEWNFKRFKNHCSFTKNNFTRNIKEIIERILPEIIICIDLDFHPDHIMTSLCFEKAMGEILKRENNLYQPIILKTFAYENSYLGEENFQRINDYGMMFQANENGELYSNPYYNLDNKIEFIADEKCYTKNLLKNVIWKAINAHKSQLLVKHTNSMINSNSIYWRRRTDNLIYKAKIKTTSSNANYLNDFLYCDSSDILNGNRKKVNYDKGIWIPDENDPKKEIKIEFPKQTYVKYMNLYNGKKNDKFIKNIEIEFDNVKKEYKFSNKRQIQKITIDKNIKNITIRIKEKKCENGYSEIELFDDEAIEKNQLKGIIENCWTNNFIVTNKNTKKYKLDYNNNENEIISVDTKGLKNGKYQSGYLWLNKKTQGYIIIECNKQSDKIFINKNASWRKINIMINKLRIILTTLSTKVYRKCFIK